MHHNYTPLNIDDLKEFVKNKIYINSYTYSYWGNQYDDIPNDIFMVQYATEVDSLTEDDLLDYLPMDDDLTKQQLRNNDVMRQRFGLAGYTPATLKVIATKHKMSNQNVRLIVRDRARRIGRICKDHTLSKIRNQYCKDVVLSIISHIDDNKIRNQYCKDVTLSIIDIINNRIN